MRLKNRKEQEVLDELCNDQRVRRMQTFRQHGHYSTYDHCINVAEESCHLSQLLHIPVHEDELVTGAMLHDYYLYDWHTYTPEKIHGFYHPEYALENAEKDFTLTKREKNIIRSHMWPLTVFHMPTCREAWLVCLADKICAVEESLKVEKHAHR